MRDTGVSNIQVDHGLGSHKAEDLRRVKAHWIGFPEAQRMAHDYAFNIRYPDVASQHDLQSRVQVVVVTTLGTRRRDSTSGASTTSDGKADVTVNSSQNTSADFTTMTRSCSSSRALLRQDPT
jgi:hypothetical protein